MHTRTISNCSRQDALWACLYFPRLPLEVFTRGHDETPVIVTEQQRICHMNPAATTLGIKAGSSIDTAYSLSEQVKRFDRDTEREFQVLENLAQWAYQFTPGVSVKSPDCLLLDITGCLKLFGGLLPLRQQLADGLADLGYSSGIGINHTPLAAMMTALAGVKQAPGNSIMATLQHVPVDLLRVDKDILASLKQMGIATLSQLMGLPRDGLSRRFGVFFADYLDRLSGDSPDPQKFIDETPRFKSEINFLTDVTDIQSLVFPVRRLLAELTGFLNARQLHINRFSLRLSHRHHPARKFSVNLARPDNNLDMFLMLTQLQLDKIDDMPEVDSLAVAAKTFYKAEGRDFDLFGDLGQSGHGGTTHTRAERDKAYELLNLLRTRLGQDSCFGLSQANDHRPEKAWRTLGVGQQDNRSPTPGEPRPRPLFLLQQPKPLREVHHCPVLNGKLEILRGPERIDSGWWDEEHHAPKDYYVARHDCGALYWIYRDRSRHHWFLHGIFS